MFSRRILSAGVVLGMAVTVAHGQDSRGRKYKAPPETSHIEVLVLKDANQKPIPNAAVVFHSIKDGKDEGNLEIKTDSEGKAIIDVIPTGSNVDVQVIADGFATFANTYQVNEATRAIEIRMVRPRAQVSTYVDTRGQAAGRPAGVQEPTKPSGGIDDKQPAKPGTTKTLPPTDTNPPNVHPDNQYSLEPATPARPQQQPPAAPAPPQL
jgi:hypothetical protein